MAIGSSGMTTYRSYKQRLHKTGIEFINMDVLQAFAWSFGVHLENLRSIVS